MNRRVPWWGLALGCVLVGCGDHDGAMPAPDAGGADDAGRPDAGGEPDAGAPAEDVVCDLRAPEPCAGGAECVVAYSFATSWGASPESHTFERICREGLRVAEGLPCAYESLPGPDGRMRLLDVCTEGTWCSDATGDFVCRRACGPDLASCEPGERCITFYGRSIAERIGQCVPEEPLGCDAVLQTGCDAGQMCFLFGDALDPDAGSGICYAGGFPADAWSYTERLGGACYAFDCGPGQACVEESGDFTCRKLCDTSGMAMSTAMAPDGVPWGACPESAPTCVPLLADYATPAGYCD